MDKNYKHYVHVRIWAEQIIFTKYVFSQTGQLVGLISSIRSSLCYDTLLMVCNHICCRKWEKSYCLGLFECNQGLTWTLTWTFRLCVFVLVGLGVDIYSLQSQTPEATYPCKSQPTLYAGLADFLNDFAYSDLHELLRPAIPVDQTLLVEIILKTKTFWKSCCHDTMQALHRMYFKRCHWIALAIFGTLLSY